MIGIASFLVVLLVGLVVTRVATVALRTTGLSADAARFQARSAVSGVGFTTEESEDIVNHPARRRIVLGLMLLSGAGMVTTLASLLISFANTSGYQQAGARLLALLLTLLLVWRLAASDWIDRHLSAIIERAIARWGDFDARDYVRLLALHDEYSVAEITVDDGEWLDGRSIGELRLANEGVVVLGIRRPGGYYVGAPTGETELHAGDTVIVYGRAHALQELEQRRAGAAGDAAHDRATAEHERIVADQVRDDPRRLRRGRHQRLTGRAHR